MITCCTVLIYLFFMSGANTMFNIINGNIVFPAGIFNLHQHLSQRNNSSVFTDTIFIPTTFIFHNYVPSVITAWGTLPVGIRSSSSVLFLSITYCTWLMSCINCNFQLFTCCLPYLCIVLLISLVYSLKLSIE